jgi:glutathione S-transferase
MLTIWGRRNSINVMKVLWVCEEMQLPYRQIDAGMQFGVVDTPEYGALNPNRKVPTIEDEGFVLSESNTIVRYLAAKHGRNDLLSSEIEQRADIERWMDWASFSLALPMTPLFWQLIRTPAEKRDQKLISANALEAERCMRVLEGQLHGRDFLVGSAFSLADVPAAAFVHRWLALPIERPALPRLLSYYQRMLARPAYRQHVALALS